MEKFIPKEKRSKKMQKEQNAKSRNFWTISPVSRIKESDKVYRRSKAKTQWKKDMMN